MRLFFIRHGQTTANLDKIYAGQSDVPLTEQGKQEALRSRAVLDGISFDRVYSSDLSRAVMTQQIALPGETAVQTPLLREYDVGSLVGMGFQEARLKYGDGFRKMRDYTSFGGENSKMVDIRLRQFLAELEKEPCENVAVFAHFGIIHAMLRVTLCAEFDRTAVACDNCSVNVFQFEGGQWRLKAWNYGVSL